MNNKSFRISTKTGDKNIKLNIQQNFDILEILSLKIYQKDLYNSDITDYGVIVGRVENKGVGIPNCRVSVFIPLDDTETNSLIRSIYPFENINDSGYDGKRYNLLPRIKENNEFNNFISGETTIIQDGYDDNIYNLGYKPETPTGSFFNKEEFTSNSVLIEVYEKYYKYSTVTNDSGDYMIMGVPTGTQLLHMDCDLTDIGKYSMKPIFLNKVLGYSNELFSKSGTRIKKVKNLDNAPHIITQNLSVNVIPFNGVMEVNDESRDIGVTRQDFIINASIVPTFTVFSAGMTMGRDSGWYDYVKFRFGLGIATWTIPVINVTIPVPFITIKWDDESNPNRLKGAKKKLPGSLIKWIGNTSLNDPIDQAAPSEFYGGKYSSNSDKADLFTHRNEKFNLKVLSIEENNTSPRLLTETEYVTLKDSGQFSIIVPCNKSFKITNEQGVLVDAPEGQGLPTQFDGSVYTYMEGDIVNDENVDNFRTWLKVPQSINYTTNNKESFINEVYTFDFNKFYSTYQRWWSRNQDFDASTNFDLNVGSIRNIISDPDNTYGIDYSGNTHMGNTFVNFCLYYLQSGNEYDDGTSDLTTQDTKRNTNDIGGGLVSSNYLATPLQYRTGFIHVPKKDIVTFLKDNKKSNYNLNGLVGNDYKSPINGSNTNKNFIYFKGLYESDVFRFMFNNNIL